MRLETLALVHFEDRVGEAFRLSTPGLPQPLEAELVEASESPANYRPPQDAERGVGAAGLRRVPFSLVFRGPWEPVLPQGIYDVAHPELGTLPIFLVPIGREDDGVRYEAVFS